jgi:hypothetical protein
MIEQTEATANGKATTDPSALIALDHDELPAVRYRRLIEARRGLRDQADVKTSGLTTVNASRLLEELQGIHDLESKCEIDQVTLKQRMK